MSDAILLPRVVTLRDLRRARDLKAAELAAKRAWFEAEYGDLIREAKETALRAVALDTYLVTKDKAPCVGVVVKEFDTLHFDPTAAYEWAKATNMALIPEALDKKAFEKIAKASPGIAGSYVIVEPRITIATDLDKALASVEASV